MTTDHDPLDRDDAAGRRDDPDAPLTAGQTEADLRRHGWQGEVIRDGSDKPNTEEVPPASRRKPGTYVDPEA